MNSKKRKKTNKQTKRMKTYNMLQDISIEILVGSMKDKFLWPNITYQNQRTIMLKKFHKINQEINRQQTEAPS